MRVGLVPWVVMRVSGFQPSDYYCVATQAFGPGWYVVAPLALGDEVADVIITMDNLELGDEVA